MQRAVELDLPPIPPHAKAWGGFALCAVLFRPATVAGLRAAVEAPPRCHAAMKVLRLEEAEAAKEKLRIVRGVDLAKKTHTLRAAPDGAMQPHPILVAPHRKVL